MVRPADLEGMNTVVVGVAREGTALARYLRHAGAHVVCADSKREDALGQKALELKALGVELVLGGQMPRLEEADVLFASPGVPPHAPIIVRARELGVPISSEPRLFSQICPVPIVGITGSSGKTTTTALTGRMYSADGRLTWVGGNIGTPLTARMLGEPVPDVAVMELSSFQLEFFSPEYQGAQVEEKRSSASRVISTLGYSPHVAAITNITPNHLDRHITMDAYVRAKENILAFQGPDDWVVLNAEDRRTKALTGQARGGLLTFGLDEPVEQGALLQQGELLLRFDGRERSFCRADEVRLRGRHNLANVLAAACCAVVGGVEPEAIREAVLGFAGVAHRMETVAIRHGVEWVNDSIATAPERAMAALHSFDQPVVLLAGGRDKHLPWEAWADLVLHKARMVVAFGEAVPIIERALADAMTRNPNAAGVELHVVETLEQSVVLAAGMAKAGDVVLLSPGGTSFDAFVDFEERGRRFSEMVAEL